MKRKYNEPILKIAVFDVESVETNSAVPIPQESNRIDAKNWIDTRLSGENPEKFIGIIYF